MRRSIFFLVNFAAVFMPALSPSMETGTIVEWKKKVGDLVKENEVFCTVQTDKAVVDYTNTFEAGYLAKILHKNGETVPVAKTIAVLVDDPADVAKADEYVPDDEAAGDETKTTATTTNKVKSAETTTAAPAKPAGSTSEPPEDVDIISIFMPALSPSMETGTIVEWKKKVGDLVKENEVFCTVQTDKAVVDYTNTFEAGYLAKILHKNGETVPVAKTIALMVNNAEDVPKLANYSPEGAETNTTTESAPITTTTTKASTNSTTNNNANNTAKKAVKLHGGSLDEAIAASGPGVVRIAARLDRNTLESITPTGRGGRFCKSDFAGLPGFNYDDATPPTTTTTTTSTVAASTPAAAAAATVVVMTKAFPVYNFKVSDTTLLKQLLRTMPLPKPKKVKEGN
ncbi:Biotin/lipoyl attachment [Trypanosoma melophagium]|uniref:Biotin/lipoyl attachment n=1 Tax=Trypanosoma melophagium TaxID=715481 RepID=UPI00351A19C0|nr:Biotin/lipoyl attachment [Trypanosoma melophagium]